MKIGITMEYICLYLALPLAGWLVHRRRKRGGGGAGGQLAPLALPTVYIMNFIAVLQTVLHVGIVPQRNHIFVV